MQRPMHFVLIAAMAVALLSCSQRGRADHTDVTVVAQCDSSALQADAASLSFVDVEVSTTVHAEVAIENTSTSTLTVELNLLGDDAAEFSIQGGHTLTIPANATVRESVAFRPTRAGAHAATLQYAYGCNGQQVVSQVPLLGESVEPPELLPQIVVEPSTVTFEQVVGLREALSAVVTIRNLGSGVLKLGVQDGDGHWLPTAPEIIEDSFGELEVEPPSAEVRREGIRPDCSVTLKLALAPRSDAARRATLRIRSDDPERPILDVPIAIRPRACEVQVTPNALAFDANTGATSALVTVTNTATEPSAMCALTSIAFESRPADFSASIDLPVSLAAGQMLSIPVAYTPTGSGTISSSLVLGFANGARVALPMTAHAVPATCSSIAPRGELEVGTPGMGCGVHPASRTITVWTDCSGPITVTAVRVTGDAGALMSVSLTPTAPLDVPKDGTFEVLIGYDARASAGLQGALEVDVAGFAQPFTIATIHAATWDAPVFTDLFQATGQVTFVLSHPVVTSNIDPIWVTIDGQPFPQFDSRGVQRWAYDASSNAVTFAALAAPAAGQTLSISYHYPCE